MLSSTQSSNLNLLITLVMTSARKRKSWPGYHLSVIRIFAGCTRRPKTSALGPRFWIISSQSGLSLYMAEALNENVKSTQSLWQDYIGVFGLYNSIQPQYIFQMPLVRLLLFTSHLPRKSLVLPTIKIWSEATCHIIAFTNQTLEIEPGHLLHFQHVKGPENSSASDYHKGGPTWAHLMPVWTVLVILTERSLPFCCYVNSQFGKKENLKKWGHSLPCSNQKIALSEDSCGVACHCQSHLIKQNNWDQLFLYLLYFNCDRSLLSH